MLKQRQYIQKINENDLSKTELLQIIEAGVYQEISLDENRQNWYNRENVVFSEKNQYEKSLVYLPQPNRGVWDEELGKESRTGITVLY